MELFDFVRVMFTKPAEYAKIKNVEKGKHFFMINRFMAIKHPTTAQALNRVGQNGWAAVDLWQLVASRFQRVPGWIYTKTKRTTASEKVWKPNPEVARIWMERNGIGERELKEAIQFNPEEMKKSFTALEKQIELYAK
jgi:hypothetical protein